MKVLKTISGKPLCPLAPSCLCVEKFATKAQSHKVAQRSKTLGIKKL